MAKAWLKYPRKKIREEGVYKLLKVDGMKAVQQHCVNEMKDIFKIRKMGIELIFDPEHNSYGNLYDWVENLGTLTKIDFWMKDTESVKQVIKILIFDAIIGNNDRTSLNILIAKDNFQPLAIDEGEAFRFDSEIKVKFRDSVFKFLTVYVDANQDFITDYTNHILNNKNAIQAILERSEYQEIPNKEEILKRVDNLKNIIKKLFTYEKRKKGEKS